MLKSEYFTHPATGRLIRKMRTYLVAPLSVHEQAFHGTGRYDDLSGFAFGPDQNAHTMYQQALESAGEQLMDGGMLVIAIDPDVSDWLPGDSQLKLMADHNWSVVIMRVVPCEQMITRTLRLKETNITTLDVDRSHLDLTLTLLREAAIERERSIYPVTGFMFH